MRCLITRDTDIQRAWELKSRMDGLQVSCYMETLQGLGVHSCTFQVFLRDLEKTDFWGGGFFGHFTNFCCIRNT